MATEILRPNASGYQTNLTEQSATPHWAQVRESSPDAFFTFVGKMGGGYARDLYGLPTSSGLGIINKITVYFYNRGNSTSVRAKASIRLGSTTTDGAEKIHETPNVWEYFSQEWSVNPVSSQAWEWAEIDALQIGINLSGYGSTVSEYCTQLYVEVDYTPRFVSATINYKWNVGKLVGKAVQLKWDVAEFLYPVSNTLELQWYNLLRILKIESEMSRDLTIKSKIRCPLVITHSYKKGLKITSTIKEK